MGSEKARIGKFSGEQTQRKTKWIESSPLNVKQARGDGGQTSPVSDFALLAVEFNM